MKSLNKRDENLQLMNWESAEVVGFNRQYFCWWILLLFLLIYFCACGTCK